MDRRLAAVVAVMVATGGVLAFGGYDRATGEGNIERLLTDTGVVGTLLFVLVMWLTQPLGEPGVVSMVPAGNGSIVLLRPVFGQLAPADWLLGVSKVSTRNFLIGTAIDIITGVVLLVVAGGGLFDAPAGMSTSTRRLVVAVVVSCAVARRSWLCRRRRQTLT